jgi:hypothetical protein
LGRRLGTEAVEADAREHDRPAVGREPIARHRAELGAAKEPDIRALAGDEIVGASAPGARRAEVELIGDRAVVEHILVGVGVLMDQLAGDPGISRHSSSGKRTHSGEAGDEKGGQTNEAILWDYAGENEPAVQKLCEPH